MRLARFALRVRCVHPLTRLKFRILTQLRTQLYRQFTMVAGRLLVLAPRARGRELGYKSELATVFGKLHLAFIQSLHSSLVFLTRRLPKEPQHPRAIDFLDGEVRNPGPGPAPVCHPLGRCVGLPGCL